MLLIQNSQELPRQKSGPSCWNLKAVSHCLSWGHRTGRKVSFRWDPGQRGHWLKLNENRDLCWELPVQDSTRSTPQPQLVSDGASAETRRTASLPPRAHHLERIHVWPGSPCYFSGREMPVPSHVSPSRSESPVQVVTLRSPRDDPSPRTTEQQGRG